MTDFAIKAKSVVGQPFSSDTLHLLKYFAWQHLPPHLQQFSMPFGKLAESMAATLPQGPELTAGLRKLLEAKDCAVRAALNA